MINKNFSKANISIFLILILLIIVNSQMFNNKKPPYFINMQNDAYHFNTQYLKHFSFGQQRLIVAMLWVETLMNLDITHYKKQDLNSWPYLRFSLIANLDNKFYENYLYGAQYLSVVKDDKMGAKDLYDRGLKQFPHDYWLNFAAGYHYFIELSDLKKAIKFFKIANKSPKAPNYLSSLIARLEYEQGNLNAAYQVLLAAYQHAPTGALKQNYFEKLYSIKAQIDLRCLNNHGTHCAMKDLRGKKYIKKRRKFQAQYPLSPLHIFKKDIN